MFARAFSITLTAVTLCAVAPTAHAHLAFINWEDTPAGGFVHPGDVIENQFNMWGTVYQGDLLTIRDNPLTAISNTQVAVLTHTADPLVPPVLRFDFVIHGTNIQSIGDFVGIIGVNAASPNTVLTLSAWDTEDGLIATLSTIVENTNHYDPFEDTELVIFHPNIAYVTLTATAGGLPIEVEIDNLRYNHLLPAPGAVGLCAAVGAWASRRRRTV